MKRALLLTYHVPPRRGIASIRVEQLMRTLPRFGWEVVAVTPSFDDLRSGDRLITTGVLDFKEPVRRMLGVAPGQSSSAKFGVARSAVGSRATLAARAIGATYGITEFANRQFGWLRHGSRAVRKILREEHFDAVISTSPPEGVHAVAASVARQLPWVADLRDPWIGRGAYRGATLDAVDQFLEPRILRYARAITTVSEPIANGLRERYPSALVRCIRNAFTQEEWSDIPFSEPKKTTFLYAGQLYGMRRDPRPFFAALESLIDTGAIDRGEVHVDFYGDDSEWLTGAIDDYELGDIVSVHGNRPRSEILERERGASRLLLFLWDDPSENATYTGKFFEYLGARRRMLVVGGPDQSVLDRLILDTRCGERARTQLQLQKAILIAVREQRNGHAAIVPPDMVSEFESTSLGQHFAEVLDEITSPG